MELTVPEMEAIFILASKRPYMNCSLPVNSLP